MKDMTETLPKNGVLMWQTTPQDGVANPPILIGAYMDCFGISQENTSHIVLQYEDVDEFCKNLKALAKQAKEGKLE